MIVFGWRTYLLKTVSLGDLGYFMENDPGRIIEYRQKYFHLFWIPVFPLGRFWALRQGKDLYAPNAELAAVLENHKNAGKMGLLAWSGILAAIAIWAYISISDSAQERSYRKRSEKNEALLSTYFTDTAKTSPVLKKLMLMDALADSVLASIKYQSKEIDTSINNLLKLYLEAEATRKDSLTEYTEDNTFSIFKLDNDDRNDGASSEFKDYKESIIARKWVSYSQDTSSVFSKMRQIQAYKYLLLVKEYNHVEPEMMTDGFAPGYSLLEARILSVESGKELKKFKLLSTNSDQVSYYSMGTNGSLDSKTIWLKNDLHRNAREDAEKYVFNHSKLTIRADTELR